MKEDLDVGRFDRAQTIVVVPITFNNVRFRPLSIGGVSPQDNILEGNKLSRWADPTDLRKINVISERRFTMRLFPKLINVISSRDMVIPINCNNIS